jgi:hypothetical protein
MAEPIHHFVRNYDDYLTGCGKRRATGYAQDSVTNAVHAVTCQGCMASRGFEAECARQEVGIWTGRDGLLHLNDRRLEQAFADSLALGVPQFGAGRFRFDQDEVHMTVTAFQALMRAAVVNSQETP